MSQIFKATPLTSIVTKGGLNRFLHLIPEEVKLCQLVLGHGREGVDALFVVS